MEFASKEPCYPTHSTSRDKSTHTEFSWANRSLGSRFTTSGMSAPVRAQPSTNCQHPLKSTSLPQSHLSGISSQGPEAPKGTGDDCAKSPHVRSCCLSASRCSLCCRRCPHHGGGFQTSPAHRDSSQLSLGAQFPQPFTSSAPQSHFLLSVCG